MLRNMHRRGVYATIVTIAAALMIGVGLTQQVRAADFDCSTVTDIPLSECEALVDIYNAMNGENWNNNSGWLDSLTACGWIFVDCTGNNVTGLSLANNGGSGTVPASIADLPELMSLGLGDIVGAVPTEVATLTWLESLTLRGSYSNTLFTGPLPNLGTLDNLTSLRIENSTVGGALPAWITPTNFPNLTVLSLRKNGFTGSVPSSLTAFVGLNNLALGENALSGAFPDFSATCGTLEVLVLSYNSFTAGPVPGWLNGTTCPNITSLELRRTGFNGAFPDFSDMSLLDLAISDNHFDSGPVPAWLLDLDGVSYLDISNTRRTGNVPTFTNTQDLTILMLQSNLFSGTIPASYNETNYPGLVYLTFLHNQITGIAEEFATFSVWMQVSVDYNAIIPSTLPSAVLTYLNANDANWSNTSWSNSQLVPVTSYAVAPATGSNITVTVTNIPLASLNTVTYSVMGSTTAGGPYTELKQFTDDNQVTTSTTITGLTPNTTYYIVIKSLVGNFFGNPMHGILMASPDSAEQSVLTGETTVPVGKPSKPVLSTPANNLSISGTKSPVLTWVPNPAGEGVTSYKLVIKNDATGVNVLNQTFAAGDVCTATCTVDLAALSPVVSLGNAAYNWQVTAINPQGNAKSARLKFSITKPAKPVAIAPVANVTLNAVNPTLTFTIPNAAITTLKVMVTSLSGGTPVNETFDAATVCTALNCTVTLTSALGSGDYTWHVKAQNVNGKGKSNSAAFKIVFPDKAVNLTPTGNATVIGQTPTLTWDEVTNATEYRITIKPKSGKKLVVGWVASGSEGLVCAAGTCTLDLTQVTGAPLLKKGKQTWFVETRNTALHATSKTKSASAQFKVTLP